MSFRTSSCLVGIAAFAITSSASAEGLSPEDQCGSYAFIARVVQPWVTRGIAPHHLEMSYLGNHAAKVFYNAQDMHAPGPGFKSSSLMAPQPFLRTSMSDVYLVDAVPPAALAVRAPGGFIRSHLPESKDGRRIIACPFLQLATPTKAGLTIVPYFMNGSALVGSTIRSSQLVFTTSGSIASTGSVGAGASVDNTAKGDVKAEITPTEGKVASAAAGAGGLGAPSGGVSAGTTLGTNQSVETKTTTNALITLSPQDFKRSTYINFLKFDMSYVRTPKMPREGKLFFIVIVEAPMSYVGSPVVNYEIEWAPPTFAP